MFPSTAAVSTGFVAMVKVNSKVPPLRRRRPLPPQDDTSVTSTTTSEGSTPANFAIMFWYKATSASESRSTPLMHDPPDTSRGANWGPKRHEPSSTVARGSWFVAVAYVQPYTTNVHDPSSVVAVKSKFVASAYMQPGTSFFQDTSKVFLDVSAPRAIVSSVNE